MPKDAQISTLVESGPLGLMSGLTRRACCIQLLQSGMDNERITDPQVALSDFRHHAS